MARSQSPRKIEKRIFRSGKRQLQANSVFATLPWPQMTLDTMTSSQILINCYIYRKYVAAVSEHRSIQEGSKRIFILGLGDGSLGKVAWPQHSSFGFLPHRTSHASIASPNHSSATQRIMSMIFSLFTLLSRPKVTPQPANLSVHHFAPPLQLK